MTSQRDLLQRVAAGDEAAFEDLYVQLHDRLYGFLYRLTGRAAAAEELINDTMLVVWRSAAAFEGRSAVSTWVFGIAYRKARKELERTRRDRSAVPLDQVVLVEPVDADRRLRRTEIRERLTAALEQLSLEHRAVIELTYFGGHSYREIAEIVGCPENTVKTRMFHARRRLRPILRQLRPADERGTRQRRRGT